MKNNIFVFVLTLVFFICHFMGTSQEIRLDHVIVIVSDLNETIGEYEENGFNVKKGRLHDNGLLNAHIKFKNKSSLEIMSVQGKATDDLSKEYLNLLKGGEGGAFIAISGIEMEEMEMKLKK